MRYAIIKNVPLGDIIPRKKGGGLEWAKYGFNVKKVSRLAIQGNDSFNSTTKEFDGNDFSLIPIEDESKFNAALPTMQKEVDTNGLDNDAIFVYEESSAEFTAFKDAILAARTSAKAQ